MKKWQIVDLVRSFCVVGIIASHSYFNHPFGSPWMALAWGRFQYNGLYSVFLFFVVSGFLITNVLADHPGGLFRPGIFRFYVQRAGRIWPLYFLFFGLGILVYFFAPVNGVIYTNVFPKSGDYGPWFWLSIPLFMFNWFLMSHPLWAWGLQWNILWSLAVEEQFYVGYPLVLGLLKNQKALLLLLGGMLASAVCLRTFFYFVGAGNVIVYAATPAVFDLIAVGIALHLARQRWGPNLSRGLLPSWVLFISGLAILVFFYLGTRENDYQEMIYAPMGLGLGLFFLLLGGIHLDVFQSKTLKLFSLPGKYCYGCYLIHPAVLFFVRPFLLPLNPFLGLLLLVAATTLIAGVSYHFFEMPMNALIRRRWSRLPG